MATKTTTAPAAPRIVKLKLGESRTIAGLTYFCTTFVGMTSRAKKVNAYTWLLPPGSCLYVSPTLSVCGA